MRGLRMWAPVMLAAVVLAGCGQGSTGGSTVTGQAAPQARAVSVASTFGPTDTKAITYKPDLVPVGSTVKVDSRSGAGSSTVTLELTGLLPNHHYGAHAHTKACGAAAADSGPHFQHQKDPVSPSVDPAYANPQNEIWLDVTTDGAGRATATSTVAWEFTDAAHPASVVVHANHTSTEPGKAGTAGDRLACVDVAF